MAGNDFAAFAAKMQAVQRDLSGVTSRQQMARVGAKLAPEIDQAVRADIGDNSMSGWRRSGPIQVVGTSRPLSDHSVVVEPVRAAKGPMAVLERGRNQGNASGFSGPGVNRKTGTTRRTKSGAVGKVRAFKAKRWNGTTRGKGTMADASQAIRRRAPGLVEDEVVRTLAKHLRRG
jgi:hypothetical protein